MANFVPCPGCGYWVTPQLSLGGLTYLGQHSPACYAQPYPAQHNCSVCREVITGGSMVGTGDGTGQSFAHGACLQRQKLDQEMMFRKEKAMSDTKGKCPYCGMYALASTFEDCTDKPKEARVTEIRVLETEKVKVTFGLSDADRLSFTLSKEELLRVYGADDRCRRAIEERDELIKRAEDARQSLLTSLTRHSQENERLRARVTALEVGGDRKLFSEKIRQLQNELDGVRKTDEELVRRLNAQSRQLDAAENDLTRTVNKLREVEAIKYPTLTDVIANTVRETLRYKPAPGWQSIETAPQGGGSLLLYHLQYGEFVGKFVPGRAGWIRAGDGEIMPRPSHWMPLPEAPR